MPFRTWPWLLPVAAVGWGRLSAALPAGTVAVDDPFAVTGAMPMVIVLAERAPGLERESTPFRDGGLPTLNLIDAHDADRGSGKHLWDPISRNGDSTDLGVPDPAVSAP